MERCEVVRTSTFLSKSGFVLAKYRNDQVHVAAMLCICCPPFLRYLQIRQDQYPPSLQDAMPLSIVCLPRGFKYWEVRPFSYAYHSDK